jgi:hypothetical protein
MGEPNGRRRPAEARETEIGILYERVGTIERALRGFESDVDKRFTQIASDVDKRFSELNSSLTSQINSVGVKLDERAKIPWPALGVMLSFLALLGGMAYLPIMQTQARLNDDIQHLGASYLPKDVYADRHEALRASLTDRIIAQEERLSRIAGLLEDIRKTIVPRVEHEKDWTAQHDREAALARQIEDLKRIYSDIYSPKDEIKRLEQQVDELEKRTKIP